MSVKKCSKCGEEKDITEFDKTSREWRGYVYRYTHARCKKCRSEEHTIYIKKNRARISEYNAKHYQLRKKLKETCNG